MTKWLFLAYHTKSELFWDDNTDCGAFHPSFAVNNVSNLSKRPWPVAIIILYVIQNEVISILKLFYSIQWTRCSVLSEHRTLTAVSPFWPINWMIIIFIYVEQSQTISNFTWMNHLTGQISYGEFSETIKAWSRHYFANRKRKKKNWLKANTEAWQRNLFKTRAPNKEQNEANHKCDRQKWNGVQ